MHTCNACVLVAYSKYDEMLKWWNLTAGIYLLLSSNISVCRDISIRKLLARSLRAPLKRLTTGSQAVAGGRWGGKSISGVSASIVPTLDLHWPLGRAVRSFSVLLAAFV